MNDFDKPNFEKLMIATTVLYDKPNMTRERLSMYFHALDRFPIDDIKAAINSHAQDPDIGQYFPMPAHIIKFMDGGTETQAGVAWTKADKALRHIGPWMNVIFDDAIIHAVISDMGGWIHFCGVSDKEYPFRKNEFIKRYTGFNRRVPSNYPRMMKGLAQHDNETKKLASIEAPAVMGDSSAAQLVFSGGSDVAKITSRRMSMDELTGRKSAKAIEHKKMPAENSIKSLMKGMFN